MSDRYRIPDSDNRGEHARPTRPILVLITVLIQSVIATRVSRDDKLPDKLSRFLYSFLLFPSSFFSLLQRFSLSERSLRRYSLRGPVLHESRPSLNRDQPREVIISRSILFESFSFFRRIKNGERREEMLSIKNIANATRIFKKEYVHCR